MGLADWFLIFCGNIQVQNGAAISSRYKAITKRLNTDLLGDGLGHVAQPPSGLLRPKHSHPRHERRGHDLSVAVLGLQTVRRLQRQRAVSAAASSPQLSGIGSPGFPTSRRLLVQFSPKEGGWLSEKKGGQSNFWAMNSTTSLTRS